MADHLDSKNLVPFKKRRNGYHLPGLQKEAEDEIIDQVDPELRPEEQGFVRHFLAYADVMLKASEDASASGNDSEVESTSEGSKVREMPRRDDEAA